MPKWKLLCLSILVMSLTACSPEVTTKYIYKTTPSELLESPCTAVRHGDGSKEELAKAYLTNTACVRKHELVLEGIRDYSIKLEVGNNNVIK